MVKGSNSTSEQLTGLHAAGTDDDPDGRNVRNNSSSLRRALAVLDYVARFDQQPGGAHLSELAAGVKLNKSTLLRLLAPLVDAGLVWKDPTTGRYQLGPHTAYLGGVYLERLDCRAAAHDVLASLVDRTGETAHLVLIDKLEVVYVDKVESPNTIRMHSRIGTRQPLYSTSVGKALLAHLPPTVLADVIAGGMTQRTPNTITDEARLRSQLDLIQEHGYAVDDMENETGIRCVGAAIFDNLGHAIAALSVSGPDGRLTRDRVAEIGAAVTHAANEVSRRLGSRLALPLRAGPDGKRRTGVAR
ncbi:IclR family transcriptional regulator [Micromonospora globbae]|uniref:IclR family transcriptional regulator n=1 Tax=Micromonospora globbae TaxID=1894969 RepID=UPI00342CC8D7